jgi:excisionase family DNA binding protein
MSVNEPQDILNIEEAAELLGVSIKTFNKVLHSQDLPARKIGREWKFSRRALIDWVGSGAAATSTTKRTRPRATPKSPAKPPTRERRGAPPPGTSILVRCAAATIRLHTRHAPMTTPLDTSKHA